MAHRTNSFDDDFAIPPRKRLALACHPTRRGALVTWARRNADRLSLHDLFAPAALAERLHSAVDLPIEPLAGGDESFGALATLIASGALDVVVAFCEPEALPRDPGAADLLRESVLWNVPLACNAATADFLLSSPLVLGDYLRESYDEYTEDFGDSRV